MSLLMEALRKAEEAKRQAAQKERDEPDSAAPARATEGLPVDDPVAMEALLDVPSRTSEVAEPLIDLDVSLSAPVPADSPSLDVPFDFHIDESFAAVDFQPVPAAPVAEASGTSLKVDMIPMPESMPVPDSAQDFLADFELDPEIDYLKPEDLRQFKPAAELNPAPAAAASAFTLTLEEDPERQETPRAAFIADPETAALPAESVPDPALAAAPEVPVQPAPVQALAPAPLRASRVDDAQELEAPPAEKSERPRFKVPGIKATEENRKRESARAVFNAKAGKEPKSRNTRKLIAVAAVLALVPLAGGGFLLVQELGLLGGGIQYNIPAASYDAPREFPIVEEQALATTADVQLADVTQDPVFAAEVPAEAVEPVIETVVAADFSAPVDAAAPVPQENAEPVAAPVIVEPIVAAAESVVAQEAPVAVAPVAQEISAPTIAAQTAVAPEVAPPVQQSTPAPVSATPPPSPINITRSTAAPQVNAQLSQAYSSFRDQDFYAARALYQQALRELPNNRDALLGLAATAIQLGDITSARATYSKLLELDPRDALARVGLMDSMPLGDAVQTESQLKSLKAEHPEVAQLSFALGNFFASQRRWNEAQAAYYDALLAAKAESGSAVSPDFAFNLAVSLERLNQPQPAFNFYREALEQSRLVNPGFDVRVLRERLDALERVLP